MLFKNYRELLIIFKKHCYAFDRKSYLCLGHIIQMLLWKILLFSRM